ncbi:MAG: CDP-alcohol phosphatidyltransferase family protein [Labilithrix sp.]|nr:CDP-alcohol phosphatidyltransferase family protein [Labilithrix sp.]MBX3220579.1 CDP-alcohol phosphatidyltransferase family protein [Labilithrix sp.]
MLRPAHAPADRRRLGADVERPSRRGWSTLSARDLVRVPGLLSLSRIPLAALFPLTLGRPGWGLGLLALAGATDVLDGWYARRFHQQTKTGALLDGVTDKVFVLTVVASLVASGAMSVIETLLLATRDIGELALAIRLAADPRRRRRVKVPAANVGGKIATTLQYAAIVAVILGSSQRALFIGAAALAGLFASASYWNRDVAAARS